MRNDVDALVKEVNNLIPSIAEGSDKALEKLYRLTSPLILTMAGRYLADKSYDADVVSEVFLSVVKNAKTFKEDGNGLNWMYKIAKNIALNTNTKFGKEAPITDEVLDIAAAVAIDGDENLERIALRKALEGLSSEERKILYHRYWEGLTVRELAKLLHTPTMTTHYNLKKILKKLEGLMTTKK